MADERDDSETHATWREYFGSGVLTIAYGEVIDKKAELAMDAE